MTNRKTRPEAWWGKLKPEQLDAIFAHCESGITLADGVKWLHAEWNIETSTTRLSIWLQKERKDRSNAVLLDEVRADRDRAMLIGKVVGSATAITEANSTLIAQSVFEEFRKPEMDRDPKRMAAFMDLALKAKREESRAAALALAKDRFQFDAAKAALGAAGKLQQINADGGDEREKVAAAIKVLFGERPANTTFGKANQEIGEPRKTV